MTALFNGGEFFKPKIFNKLHCFLKLTTKFMVKLLKFAYKIVGDLYI